MSKKHCTVCGEPWFDAHADMLRWEAELYDKGAGCPCCKGEMPEDKEKQWHPETLADLDNGDGDPIDPLIQYENRDKRPRWERPADPILWTCKGCGVEVIRNIDDGKLEYHLPLGAKGAQWYHSHDYRDEPEETPAHTFKPDEPVCEFCLSYCDGCNAPICDTLEYGDTYDDGQSFSSDGGWSRHYCIGCFEQLCEHCHNMPDDCDCYCPDCGELDCYCYCNGCSELVEDCSCYADEEDEDDE